MENKYKKKKEDIRLQIFKKIGTYRKTRGILFFDKNFIVHDKNNTNLYK